MQKVSLTLAAHKDKPLAIAFDYAFDKDQHITLKREEKITKAISGKECFTAHTAIPDNCNESKSGNEVR